MNRKTIDARAKRRSELRDVLYARLEAGDLTLVEALRMMRKIAGKTQAEYAKMVHISPRVLIDFERGVGNPTLRSLERMFAPFGLDLGVRRRNPNANSDTPYQYSILDGSLAVVAQAHEMREAVAVARERARSTSIAHFIKDSRRRSRTVVSVSPDGELGKGSTARD